VLHPLVSKVIKTVSRPLPFFGLGSTLDGEVIAKVQATDQAKTKTPTSPPTLNRHLDLDLSHRVDSSGCLLVWHDWNFG